MAFWSSQQGKNQHGGRVQQTARTKSVRNSGVKRKLRLPPAIKKTHSPMLICSVVSRLSVHLKTNESVVFRQLQINRRAVTASCFVTNPSQHKVQFSTRLDAILECFLPGEVLPTRCQSFVHKSKVTAQGRQQAEWPGPDFEFSKPLR